MQFAYLSQVQGAEGSQSRVTIVSLGESGKFPREVALHGFETRVGVRPAGEGPVFCRGTAFVTARR